MSRARADIFHKKKQLQTFVRSFHGGWQCANTTNVAWVGEVFTCLVYTKVINAHGKPQDRILQGMVMQ